MCGIAGALGTIDPGVARGVARMAIAQRHRGPDAAGDWTAVSERGTGVALVHRRLAIIDLSRDADQPMRDPATGNVVVFNGELYDFRELRAELGRAGEVFRTQSDTEVLLRAYARWGVDALGRLRGMFAFALWDASRRTLLLARDRLGMKPLYLARVDRPGGGTALLFASELRALLASGLVERAVDPVGLASYLWNGYVVGPRTIVRGIELLPAATCVIAPAEGTETRRRYWSLPPASAAATPESFAHELSRAVDLHLVSDVPLGVFLSGGIDSSTVAALAARTGDVRTFTIGSDEPEYDESPYARAVARAIGTEHHELRLDGATLARGLPAAMASLDQPSDDGINTFFVSRAVREAGMTVALSGAGGDELFGGYRSFREVPWAAAWGGRAARVPAGVAQAVAGAAVRTVGVAPQTRWGKAADVLAARGDLVDTYQVAAASFSSSSLRDLLRARVEGALRFGLPPSVAGELDGLVSGAPLLHAISLLDTWCYLGECLLRDTDSASMASSLEVRTPFLDHHVVETAAALPEEARFQPLGRKQILRDTALAGLDPALFERPKRGFQLPFDRWSRGLLRDEMTEAFADPIFCENAGLDPSAVRSLWRDHLAGVRGTHWSRVWSLYVLGWWCRRHAVSARWD